MKLGCAREYKTKKQAFNFDIPLVFTNFIPKEWKYDALGNTKIKSETFYFDISLVFSTFAPKEL